MADNGGVTTDEIVKVFEHLGEEANTHMVFGEPETIGQRAIIPVARVSYGGGGGSGSGMQARSRESETETAPTGEGVGGGFGVRAKPMGAIVVSDEEITWSPLVDWGRLATIWSAVLGTALLLGVFRFLFPRRRGAAPA